MNLLLFTDSDRLQRKQIAVRDGRLQHLLDVLRAAPGDEIRVGEIGGLMGTGRILTLDREQAVIDIELSESPPDKLPLTLVMALPRPKMLRRILRSAAESGVRELHLLNSYRVEKSYWQTPVLEAATKREYLLQGLQQSSDTALPQVSCHRRFRP